MGRGISQRRRMNMPSKFSARSPWVLELNWTSRLLVCIYHMALHGVWSFELGDTGVLLRHVKSAQSLIT
jgi:hypothetical protein